MELLNNYNLLLNSSEEFNFENPSENTGQKKPSLRANVFLSIAMVGTMSLNPVHAAEHYEIKNSDKIQEISLKSSEQLSFEISEYSNKLIQKSFVDKSQFVENILSFKSLENSWDGYGALPLSVKCATNAIRLLDSFDRYVLEKVSDIHPNSNGTITFEWENKESEIVSLEIGKDTFTYFVDFNSLDTKFYNKQNFSFENIQMLKKYISAI